MSGSGGGKPGRGFFDDDVPKQRLKDIKHNVGPNRSFFEDESRHAASYHCHAETFVQFIKYCYYGYLEWRGK